MILQVSVSSGGGLLIPVQPEPSKPESTTLEQAKPWWQTKRALGIGICSLLALLLLTTITLLKHHKASVSQVQMKVSADTSLRLRGTTVAVIAQSIQAPRLAGQSVGLLTITKRALPGSHVKKGDLLVEFDRQDQLRDAIDKQAQLADQVQKVLYEQAKEAAARAKDETEIVQAENALNKAKLELKKVELLSRIDAEKAQEDLDEAAATEVQLKQTFELKRKAALAYIRTLEIQRERTRETMLHSQANAQLMQIHSPIDGIVVYNTIWKQGKMGEVQEGDQVRPGIPFMQVVSPEKMEVRVLVNQQDLSALHVGQQARVQFEAYGDLSLIGKLVSLDPMGITGDFSSKVRSFSATFVIEGSDPRLMPDLTAAVDVMNSAASGGHQ